MKFLCLFKTRKRSVRKSMEDLPSSTVSSLVTRHTPVHHAEVTCIARTMGNEKSILTGGTDGFATMYDYEQGVTSRKFYHPKTVTRVLFAPQISGVVTACRDCAVRLWQSNDTFPCVFEGHTLVVTAIAITNDNSRLFSGSRDNCIKTWDVESGRIISSIRESRNLITDMKLNGTMLVQTSEDKRLRLWDTRNLDLIYAFPFKNYIQTSCDIGPDGNLVVSGSNGFNGAGCAINVWDIRNRSQLAELKGHNQSVMSVAFVPCGAARYVISGSKDSFLRMWDLETDFNNIEMRLAGMGQINSVMAYKNFDVVCATDNGCCFLQKQQDKFKSVLMF